MISNSLKISLVIALISILTQKEHLKQGKPNKDKSGLNSNKLLSALEKRNLQSIISVESNAKTNEEINLLKNQTVFDFNSSTLLTTKKIENPNLNIWADYFNTPEVIVYFYNQTFSTNKTLKIRNKREVYLTTNNINDVSAPATITKNNAYLKMQMTLTRDYLDASQCSEYQLKDFNFVSIKNCTFSLLDANENLLTEFNLILLTMMIDQISINQCLVEFSQKEEKLNKDNSTGYFLNAFPNYLTPKIQFNQCKQAFCKEIEKSDANGSQEIFEPIFGQYNFKLSFINLKDYEFELFRAFMIVRKEDYDIDTISKNINDYNMIYYYNTTNANSTNNLNQNIKNIERYNMQEGNTIAFYTDITKILLIKGNFYQLNLDVFPETFDLKLIFDVQRINLDLNLNYTRILDSVDSNSGSKDSSTPASFVTLNPNILVQFEVIFFLLLHLILFLIFFLACDEFK